jgi:hypothetical protein
MLLDRFSFMHTPRHKAANAMAADADSTFVTKLVHLQMQQQRSNAKLQPAFGRLPINSQQAPPTYCPLLAFTQAHSGVLSTLYR